MNVSPCGFEVTGYVHSRFQKNLITNNNMQYLYCRRKNVIENGKHVIGPNSGPRAGLILTHPNSFIEKLNFECKVDLNLINSGTISAL
jgi:hypothetical protein